MVSIDHAESAIQTNQLTLPVERNKSLGTFILDSLVTAAHEIRTQHLKAYDRHLTSLNQRLDKDPWASCCIYNEKINYKYSIGTITKHIKLYRNK